MHEVAGAVEPVTTGDVFDAVGTALVDVPHDTFELTGADDRRDHRALLVSRRA